MNTNTTVPRLAAEIEANHNRQIEETRHYIMRGRLPTWNENERRESDNGIRRYSTARRWEQYQAGEITREKAVELATARATKQIEKATAEKLEKLDAVAAADPLVDASISVTWARSRVWGYNPTAEVWPGYTTGRASGCGYDKESAAVAEALNNNPAALRVLYDLAEKALEAGKSARISTTCTGYNWRGAICYGCGYSVLPYFEGGVGVSCFWEAFRLAGYTVRTAGSGRLFDCYTITREEAAQ